MPGKSWRYEISNNQKLPFPAGKVLRNPVPVGLILHRIPQHFEATSPTIALFS